MSEQDVYDFVIVGASLSGCYIAAQLAQQYPDKSVVLLEKAEDLHHGGDDEIRCMHGVHTRMMQLGQKMGSEVNVDTKWNGVLTVGVEPPPGLSVPAIVESQDGKMVTRDAVMAEIVPDFAGEKVRTKKAWEAIHHVSMRVASAMHEKKQQSGPWTNHYASHEHGGEGRIVSTKDFDMIDMTLKEALEHTGFDDADTLIAAASVPWHLATGCHLSAVGSRIDAMDMTVAMHVYSENRIRACLMRQMKTTHERYGNARLVLGAELKSFTTEVSSTTTKIGFLVKGQQTFIRARNLILCVPREPLCRLDGWNVHHQGIHHPVRTVTKRLVTCRIDAEFRFPGMQLWLRDTRLLHPSAKLDTPFERLLMEQQHFHEHEEDTLASTTRDEQPSPAQTPSVTPCRRINNTPAPPALWWPSVTASFASHSLRVRATANPSNQDCAVMSIYMDATSEANMWLELQKSQGAAAVRTALKTLLSQLLPPRRGATPYPFWSRVVPVYTTVWTKSPGLPTDFLGQMRDKRIFVAGRDYSTRAQGHAEGALHTASLVLDSIRRMKSL